MPEDVGTCEAGEPAEDDRLVRVRDVEHRDPLGAGEEDARAQEGRVVPGAVHQHLRAAVDPQPRHLLLTPGRRDVDDAQERHLVAPAHRALLGVEQITLHGLRPSWARRGPRGCAAPPRCRGLRRSGSPPRCGRRSAARGSSGDPVRWRRRGSARGPRRTRPRAGERSALVRWRTVPRDRSAVLEEHVEARRGLSPSSSPPTILGATGSARRRRPARPPRAT